MNTGLKKICFTIIMLGFFAPLIQQVFNIPQPKLNGAFMTAEKPIFTWNSWFDGNWQQQYSDYYETQFGFRPWLIKIKNHIEFSLFKNAHSGIVVGKEDYLYEKGYIDAYLGRDRIPFDSAKWQIQKLAFIQKHLRARNINLLVVLAPGKGGMHAKYIPDEMKPELRGITNYQQYSLLLSKSQLPYIDFNKWFMNAKDTSSDLLFTKFGVHWSAYSTAFVTDSIVKKMQSLTGKNWGYYTVSNKRTSRNPIDSDDDMMQLLNTMGISSGETYSYQDVNFTETGKKPKVLIIGDSYVWTLINHGAFVRSMEDSSQYLYYNHDIFTLSSGFLVSSGTKEKDAVPQQLDSFEYIILLNSELNLKQLGSGFIDAYYKQLSGKDKPPVNFLY